MSRYIRIGGSSATSTLTSSDVCNILSTYQGTLSAGNACLVCNLRTQYEIVCYCQGWTCCYGTTFSLSLPTDQYSEFQFGMFGICNCYGVVMYNCLHFGNSSCFCTSSSPAAYCSVQGLLPVGSCFIYCNSSADRAICWSTTSTCNQSSIFINFKKTFGYETCGALVNCPQIQWCGYYNGNCQTMGELFYGYTRCTNCTSWKTNITESDAFTRMRIISNCGIQGGTNSYWYLLGMKNRTCGI